MKYLECNHCNYKNSITSERVVFCKICGKKIDNNYTDWKKAKSDTSFETYILEETTENHKSVNALNKFPEGKQNLFKRTGNLLKPKADSDLKIFIVSTIIQLILGFILIHNPSKNEASLIENKHYIKDVQWNNYSISQQINITLPFELKKSKSVLPAYLHNYLSYNKASKAESAKSFSVTIEEFDVTEGININEKSYLTISDEYMQSKGTTIMSASSFDHIKIKEFNTIAQYGSYLMDNKSYRYENYTLTKGNKAIKIIISYIEEDKLLKKYAEIVAQSIQQNINQVI